MKLIIWLAIGLWLLGGAAFAVWNVSEDGLPGALAQAEKPAGAPAAAAPQEPRPESPDGQSAPPVVTLAPLDAPGVPSHRDVGKLPEPVRATLEAMVTAARSGEIGEMQTVLEMNELPPIVSRGEREGAIAYWKRISGDGTGRDVLAAMLESIEAGYAVKKTGDEEMYVFPYFADSKLDELSPAQHVELLRIATTDEVKTMKASGGFLGWRIGIGADGVWHYFLKGK